MRRPTRPILALMLWAVLAMLAPWAMAEDDVSTSEIFSPGSPIQVSADSLEFDTETGTYHAIGNVVITQESTTLYTDTAVLNTASGVATATGNVKLIDEGGNIAEGTGMQVDLKRKTAIIAKGRVFYKADNVYIEGEPLKKTGNQSYAATKLKFTTCDCDEGERPVWNFSASRAKVTVGEFLTGSHAFFHVKGVPIIYSPYIRFPIKRKRQTGILPPHPGYSRLRGFVIDNSFFWAISPHQDATFYLDVETARGVGTGAEYRYFRTRDSYGEFFAYHYLERDIDRVREFRESFANLSRPTSASKSRYEIKADHTEILGAGLDVKLRLHMVSDEEYFIDFARMAEQRSLESLETNLSISKSWNRFNLVAQLRHFDNLLTDDDSATFQKYPEVTFTASERPVLGSPVHLSATSTLINFYREAGERGMRLDLRPRISLPMNPGGYFEFTPSVAPRATFYRPVNSPAAGQYADRYIYDVTADLTTTFMRVFYTNSKSITALRHSVRPRLNYTYIPDVYQGDLPNFDGEDRMAATSKLTYSINSILTAKRESKGTSSYSDLVYLDLSQSYDINEANRALTSPTDKRRPFSDISGELILKFFSWVTASGRASYDVYDTAFENYDGEIDAHDGRGDSVNLSYRFIRGGERYFEANGRLHISKAFDGIYSKRYSFEESRSLETVYGVEYTHQCWGAVLSYNQKIEENLLLLTFSLKGLGQVGGVEGRMAQ